MARFPVIVLNEVKLKNYILVRRDLGFWKMVLLRRQSRARKSTSSRSREPER